MEDIQIYRNLNLKVIYLLASVDVTDVNDIQKAKDIDGKNYLKYCFQIEANYNIENNNITARLNYIDNDWTIHTIRDIEDIKILSEIRNIVSGEQLAC